jgi:hypothetical protein
MERHMARQFEFICAVIYGAVLIVGVTAEAMPWFAG